MPTCPATALAEHIGKGAVILGPDLRDVTTAVRSTFNQMLSTCGGDRAQAAARAVEAALSQREADR